MFLNINIFLLLKNSHFLRDTCTTCIERTYRSSKGLSFRYHEKKFLLHVYTVILKVHIVIVNNIYMRKEGIIRTIKNSKIHIFNHRRLDFHSSKKNLD